VVEDLNDGDELLVHQILTGMLKFAFTNQATGSLA